MDKGFKLGVCYTMIIGAFYIAIMIIAGLAVKSNQRTIESEEAQVVLVDNGEVFYQDTTVLDYYIELIGNSDIHLITVEQSSPNNDGKQKILIEVILTEK